MKHVLMVAYHFPPLLGSSGIQRTLRFAKYLPEYGWKPVVLTVTSNAYPRTSHGLLDEIPPECVVIRVPALDTARHLSLGGRYLSAMARPDRWVSWWPGAVLAGAWHSLRHRPNVIWSTFPVATAHMIGHSIHKLTGIPWVADFRDPMAQDGDPSDPKLWRSFRNIEKQVLEAASIATFASPGAVRFYSAQYPDQSERFRCIENGYDEESFQQHAIAFHPLHAGRFTLLHSGIIYPSERDPSQLFSALAALRSEGILDKYNFLLQLRAPLYDNLIQNFVEKYQLSSHVEILPPLPYGEALLEMQSADALLILQASICNNQIPAKLYEYMRCNRPIIGLCDPDGDTAKTLMDSGIYSIAPLDRSDAIEKLLRQLLQAPGLITKPDAGYVESCSRRARTQELSKILDSLS